MAGGERVRAEIARHVEQVGELDLLVAGHAGNRRLAVGIGLREGVDHLGAEARLVIQHVMGNADPRRRLAGVENILAGAAGAGAVAGLALVVELHGDADDVIALLLEQGRDHGGIDAARHRHDHARCSGAPGRSRLLRWGRRGGHEFGSARRRHRSERLRSGASGPLHGRWEIWRAPPDAPLQ